MDIRTATDDTLPALLSMLTRAYRASRSEFPDDPGVLGSYSRNDPESGPRNWVVLFDGERPVSALRLFYREVGVTGTLARVGGIGNVGTDPDYGGRRLATRVLEAAQDRLRAEGVATALLVTDIAAFYARLGYETVEQGELRGETPPDARASSVRTTGIVPPVPDAVRAWHDASAAAVTGRVRRTPALWDRWVLGFRAPACGLTAVRTDDAYVMGRHEDDGAAYRVFEGGGDPRSLRALVETVARGARTWKVPDDPLFAGVLAASRMQVSRRTRTGIMALPLRADAPGAAAFTGFLELDAF